MRVLKESIERVGGQKKRKELIQLVEIKLIGEFGELIGSIVQMIEEKLDVMNSFLIKKELPNLPVDQILTLLKNK